jgi:CheY-like chemotaxis protein
MSMPELNVRPPIRVMVAESNRELRTVISWVLAHDGRFRVVAEASDGESAAACDSVFDVALVDLAISGLGSVGMVARLHDRRPAPAIVLLAHTGAIYLRHAAAAEGAVDFLVKPDELSELADRLATASGLVSPDVGLRYAPSEAAHPAPAPASAPSGSSAARTA